MSRGEEENLRKGDGACHAVKGAISLFRHALARIKTQRY